jgi:hypothetical protein
MKHLDKILISLIAVLIATGVVLNVKKQYSIDKSKLPNKLESNSQFQKWITNARNKGIKVEGDNFRFVEDSNIFNTLWTSTASVDDDASRKLYDENMLELRKFKTSALSPNEREIVNYDNSTRFGFLPTEVFFYGLRENKILRSKITDCDFESNCFFNRASFLDNHVFFVIQMSLKDYTKKDPKICNPTQVCTYSFKVHLVDLINNSRTVYESEPIQGVLEDLKSKL